MSNIGSTTWVLLLASFNVLHGHLSAGRTFIHVETCMCTWSYVHAYPFTCTYHTGYIKFIFISQSMNSNTLLLLRAIKYFWTHLYFTKSSIIHISAAMSFNKSYLIPISYHRDCCRNSFTSYWFYKLNSAKLGKMWILTFQKNHFIAHIEVTSFVKCFQYRRFYPVLVVRLSIKSLTSFQPTGFTTQSICL